MGDQCLDDKPGHSLDTGHCCGRFPEDRNRDGCTSPIAIASGRKHAVVARHIRNRRLYDALDKWAFCSLTRSPGARAFYDQKRAAGDLYHQALRALANRLVGILHSCLKHRTPL